MTKGIHNEYPNGSISVPLVDSVAGAGVHDTGSPAANQSPAGINTDEPDTGSSLTETASDLVTLDRETREEALGHAWNAGVSAAWRCVREQFQLGKDVRKWAMEVERINPCDTQAEAKKARVLLRLDEEEIPDYTAVFDELHGCMPELADGNQGATQSSGRHRGSAAPESSSHSRPSLTEET